MVTVGGKRQPPVAQGSGGSPQFVHVNVFGSEQSLAAVVTSQFKPVFGSFSRHFHEDPSNS
jgi:hypothetical protein